MFSTLSHWRSRPYRHLRSVSFLNGHRSRYSMQVIVLLLLFYLYPGGPTQLRVILWHCLGACPRPYFVFRFVPGVEGIPPFQSSGF
jgi:hypothetical protein